MDSDPEFSIVQILIGFFVFLGLILLKYYYFNKLRSTKSLSRFFKSFFRWYSSNEKDMSYDRPGKIKFMKRSNWINLPLCILLIISIFRLAIWLNIKMN